MVFAAHDRAFSFFKGACTRGIYDNMKAAVETIFVGRERAYNRRFLQMRSHYLVDPVACNPASGWKKGQVENQVGLVRERFFTPRLRVKSYDELNAWLLDQCVGYARRTVIPNCASRRPGRCSKPNVPVWCRQDDRVVGGHRRCFGRDQTVFDPWHYVQVLALRNGGPFKDWILPAGLERVRRKLAGTANGDRQMVKILATVLSDGLPAVEAACPEALREGVHSADVIINILARRREPEPPVTISTPEALRLRHAPTADCTRYDSLRRIP